METTGGKCIDDRTVEEERLELQDRVRVWPKRESVVEGLLFPTLPSSSAATSSESNHDDPPEEES
jgi:hypothetical protein